MAESLKNTAVELMAIGLSYYDYWYGNLEIADYAISAYRRQMEIENEKRKARLIDLDSIAWRVGQYVGITTSLALGGKTKYPEKPFGFDFKEENTDAVSEQTRIENQMKAYLSKI